MRITGSPWSYSYVATVFFCQRWKERTGRWNFHLEDRDGLNVERDALPVDDSPIRQRQVTILGQCDTWDGLEQTHRGGNHSRRVKEEPRSHGINVINGIQPRTWPQAQHMLCIGLAPDCKGFGKGSETVYLLMYGVEMDGQHKRGKKYFLYSIEEGLK